MDSYDTAYNRLLFITSESGWFVYCIDEEEWHLYNDAEELLFKKPTIEELVECFEPTPFYPHESERQSRGRYKVPKRLEESPTESPWQEE